MKNTVLLCLFLILIAGESLGQLNRDSIKAELNKYIPVKHKNDYNAYVIDYLTKDSLVVYKIPYNSKGEITADFWGIAFYINKYDEKGRYIEGRYYDINGKLHFSDWPPIDKTQYDLNNNTIRIDYFGEDEKQFGRFEYVYDSENRVIEFRDLNKDLQIDKITRYEYKENGKVVLEKSFTKDNKIISDRYGIAIYYKAYQDEKREKIIEKKYLDADGNLVLKKNASATIEYAIETYTYGLKKDWIKIEYYNQKNEKVGETWQWDPPIKNKL